jgi:hypothetical protein
MLSLKRVGWKREFFKIIVELAHFELGSFVNDVWFLGEDPSSDVIYERSQTVIFAIFMMSASNVNSLI